MLGTTSELQSFLDAWHAGDAEALTNLIDRAQERLKQLVRRMLRGDRVHEFHNTDDILQEALIRLHRSLREDCPTTLVHFLRLSALHIRRILVDIARSLDLTNRPPEVGLTEPMIVDSRTGDVIRDHPESGPSPHALTVCSETWQRFYQAVSEFEDREREVFDAVWIHRLSFRETADLIGITRQAVMARWYKVAQILGQILEDLEDS